MNAEARDQMIREVRAVIPRLDAESLPPDVLADLWAVCAAYRELWYHASPHHHKEIITRIANGKAELML